MNWSTDRPELRLLSSVRFAIPSLFKDSFLHTPIIDEDSRREVKVDSI
jgi:hypothetical protein